MEELKDKIENMKGRTHSLMEDLMDLEEEIQPEKGAEGTVKARLKESIGRIDQAKKKLDNVSNIAREDG